MKKQKNLKSKLAMLSMAVILPISTTGAVYSLSQGTPTANADDTETTSFHDSSYSENVSLSNSSFSSGSSYSISTSLTGWTGQNNDNSTTAGIIDVEKNFTENVSSTYRLSNNPKKSGNDNYILMINSRTKDSSDTQVSHQGYKSSSVTLDANSYYSFQVAFKNDTNYISKDKYTSKGAWTNGEREVTNFTTTSFSTDENESYVSFKLDTNKSYYVKKVLTDNGGKVSALGVADNTTEYSYFYNDEKYVGVTIQQGSDKNYVFVEKSDVNSDNKNKILTFKNLDANYYICENISYNGSEYTIANGTEYFEKGTEYTSINDFTYGSIYLTGLTDADGKEIDTKFEKISSKEWSTFNFYVATGDESQTVNLELWLGTKDSKSSGVAFFDECKVTQYCESAFWNAYKDAQNNSYSQTVTTTTGSTSTTTTETTKQTQIQDLRTIKTSEYDTTEYNFDFENEKYGTTQAVSQWTTSGTGRAGIFNTNSPESFKSTTGYNFVGSTLECDVDYDNNTVTITQKPNILALWATDGYVDVKSKDIKIESQKVYKISVQYKIADKNNLSGDITLAIEENDTVLTTYSLSEDDYSVTEKTTSEALTSNGSSEFNNGYATAEFYVKGGVFYDSAVNLHLSLGSATSGATGCVAFDNVKVELASSTDYEDATNKIALGQLSGTPSVSNGYFNDTTVDEDGNFPLSPDDWTISQQEDKIVFGGVINSSEKAYKKYQECYNNLKTSEVADNENPYLWATHASPCISEKDKTAQNNVLMLANINPAWQSVTSPSISLSADSYNKLSFSYYAEKDMSVTITDSNQIVLFEQTLNKSTEWQDYTVYFHSGSGASTFTVKFDFGTSSAPIEGYAYLDNFEFDSSTEDDFNAIANTDFAIDMTNNYMNLSTNDITTDLNTTKNNAYSGEILSGNSETNRGGVVKSSKFTNESQNDTYKIEDETNVFYFENGQEGSYAITSKYNFDLASDTYYMLSFKVQTTFAKTSEEIAKDTESHSYGVTIGLTGFDYMKEIVCEGEYKVYQIFLNPSEATTAQLYMSFNSDSIDTCGSAVIYDVAIETIEESDYTTAKEKFSAEDYDLNSSRMMVAKSTETDEDSEETDEDSSEDEEETTDKTSPSGLDWSLLISSIIMGLAIIIAVIGVVLKNIKVKKIEKKRKESYDRDESLNLDNIKQRAKKEQDEEKSKLQSELEKFKTELDALEKTHKAQVLELREKDVDKISKETEKEFKNFAKRSTVLTEKIENLNKQIAEVDSAEHLIDIERTIYAKDEAEKRKFKKEAKENSKKDSK